jgi:hypothetical protein
MDDVRGSLVSALRATNVTAAVTGVGVAIRYSFYLFGAIVFAIMASGTLYVFNARTKFVEADTSFRLASNDLAKFPVKTLVLNGTWAGLMESRQYGNLHDRDTDMSIFMVVPSKSSAVERYFSQEVLDMPTLRNSRVALTTRHYDMETRFGPVRGADLTVDTDGRIKQCIVFLTRFDTTAVYLKGWLCEASGAKPSPDRLACMIDKLTLDKPLESKEADAFLRTKMARSASCSSIPVWQTMDTRVRRGVSPPQSWSLPNAQRR